MWAAGFAPELAACARCGEADGLRGFSAAAGGAVCPACQAGAFELSQEARLFMIEALGRPLAEAPPAGAGSLARVERAICDTLEHHAHVRLRSAA
jgi:DNA repair protein RecO (recombination protein O)